MELSNRIYVITHECRHVDQCSGEASLYDSRGNGKPCSESAKHGSGWDTGSGVPLPIYSEWQPGGHPPSFLLPYPQTQWVTTHRLCYLSGKDMI